MKGKGRNNQEGLNRSSNICTGQIFSINTALENTVAQLLFMSCRTIRRANRLEVVCSSVSWENATGVIALAGYEWHGEKKHPLSLDP